MSSLDLMSVRLKDLRICQTVAKLQSLRDCARILGLSPSEVSKAIKAMEEKMGIEIFKRSHTGLIPTEASKLLLESIEKILGLAEEIEISLRDKSDSETRNSFTIAATSFLTNWLVVPNAISWSEESGGSHFFRFLDLSPDDLLPAGLSGVFDLAFHLGEQKWPNTWVSKKAGTLRWSLFASKSHALSDFPSLEDVLQERFVVPSYYDKQGMHLGNDHFPVPVAARKIGATTSTAEAALPVLLHSQYIAHLPDVVAEPYLKSAALRRILPQECPHFYASVYLSAKADNVSQNLFSGLLKKMSMALQS